ncbi:MAG: hypothetical protein JWQ19_800 [Subtercola sp.]|nr:hypothetical protein [Subtercola sp.]
MAATYTHVLVLDFDGTVCLGDGPVLAYARLLDAAFADDALPDAAQAAALPDAAQADAAQADTRPAIGATIESGGRGVVLPTVERFLGETDGRASTSPTAEPPALATGAPDPGPATNGGPTLSSAEALALVAGSVDGYEAAERLGRALGATDAQLGAAYASSRAELASGAIETNAPDGLAELLLGLPETVQVVLVTNAPENGVTQQLTQLGLADCFAELVTSAGKPAGMAPIVERLLAQNELSGHPQRLLSVGDIWRNDLAPAAGLGCATALIERHSAPTDARPTYRATDIRQLYPAIAAWAATT